MKFQPLITVIVPVYNVKNYLRKCVESILNQNFKKYELLLIDDGSTDQSSELCDTLEEMSSRIKTFHKKNGGLSDARNFGVTKAESDYIVFVDSDDYVDENYLSSLWLMVKNYKADLGVSGIKVELENGKITKEIIPLKNNNLSKQDALEKMCYGEDFPIMAYAKIYKKDLLIKAPYPVSKLHEDIATTYKIINLSTRISACNQASYHYLQRRNSILHGKIDERHFYSIIASKEIITFLKNKFPMIIDAGFGRLLLESISLSHRLIKINEEKKFFELQENLKKYFENNLLNSIINRKIPFKTRIQFMLFIKFPKFYFYLYSILKKSKGMM